MKSLGKFAFEEDQLKKNAKEMLQREFQVQINFLNETRLALKKERNKIVSALRQPNIRVRLKQKKIDKRDFWDAKLVKNQIKITNMEWDMQRKPLFHKYDAITAIRKSKDTYYALIKRNGKFYQVEMMQPWLEQYFEKDFLKKFKQFNKQGLRWCMGNTPGELSLVPKENSEHINLSICA